MPRILSLLLAMLFAGAVQAQGQPEPLVKKVNVSINNGVNFLLKQQLGDGNWDSLKNKEGVGSYQCGMTGLAVLALLHCDGVIDDAKLEAGRKKAIQDGLATLRKIESPKVYDRALQTMALAEAGLPQDRALIKRNVDWLLDVRVYRDNKFIGWEYGKAITTRESDASNSQYAMLALWYARQAGVAIERKVWEEIRAYYTETQQQDGGWVYSPYYGPVNEKGASITMTVAGINGFLIAGMELNDDREQWPLPKGKVNNCGKYSENLPLAKGFHWLNQRFRIDLDQRTYYHLYGLERAGRLSGMRFFGEHDWYREGCEHLTKVQDPTGAWKTQGGWDRWPSVNTCFALLFLSKGRTPVLISKLVHGNWPRREDDGDWNNDRNDLRHLIEYVAKEGKLFGKKALAWQTYDIRRAIEARLVKNNVLSPEEEAEIVADMKQSPILYITGHESPRNRFQAIEIKLIKRFVENGGFIFAEACCADPNFDKGFKDWVNDVWGQDLTLLESTHAVWTCYNSVTAGDPYKLMGLQVGCRTVMVYSPQDLSCRWESNRLSDGPTQRAFELGANIIAYGTGRTPPQPRLTPIEIAGMEKEEAKSSRRGTFQVGQIRHAADWQPAPKAMRNLMENVHKVYGLDVLLKTRPIGLQDPITVRESKFLYMHGRDRFSVQPDHFVALRFNLENGGLLLADACCGSEKFDKSFRQFAQELFTKEKLVRVPVDPRDRLFSAALNGTAISADNIKCRTKVNGQAVAMEPYLEGIQLDGRWVVLYSKYDLGCALERNTSPDCVGYDHASALRIAMAAVLYSARP